MTISDEEYNALVEELVAKQNRRNLLSGEIMNLQDTINQIEYTRRGLPTEPGMYWHPDEGWPAVLTETGQWQDGWGNDFELENQYDLENVKRVEFVDE